MLERTDKILSRCGYCARSDTRKWLRDHEVIFNSQRITDQATKADATAVTINGVAVDHAGGILVMMHKPAGYICSHESGEGPLVYDLLPRQWMERNPVPMTIGRLDKDTTGLLLITDDTKLVHNLTSPKRKVEKIYQVTVDRALESDIVTRFASGEIMLVAEDKPCLPATLTITGEMTCDVALYEGKYHQIKRMFAACGYAVTKLHRTKFGEYGLDGLVEGEIREVVEG